MLWVCRAGKNACYLEQFVENGKIFLPWEGYNVDLTEVKNREEFKNIVMLEKKPNNRTTLANWAGMLYSFCLEMNIGDYVLIPKYKSEAYILAEITGEYEYCDDTKKLLHHCRNIKIMNTNVPREVFPQNIQYSLGAFRSVFHTKYETEIISAISLYEKERKLNY